MLILDELKKNDPQLRLVALVLAGGLFILLGGLWWVQIVSAREYESHLETQSYRTVRIPAVRGKILDSTGHILAENRPQYNLGLYLDDLRKQFDAAYARLLNRVRAYQAQRIAAQEKKLGRPLTKVERRQFALTPEEREHFRVQARFFVASDVVRQVSERLGQPMTLNGATFERHYNIKRALPYPLLTNLDTLQIARFEEQDSGTLGVDMDLQAVRIYPFGTTAGHLLGYLQRDDSSEQGEDSSFSYRLPDYRGVVGVEGGFDTQLRGRAGAQAVLVNNLGYRQSENIWSQPEPGHNVVLTIDLDVQRAAEESLKAHQGENARAAIVVMNVRNGDVIAMVSSPEINPVYASNSPTYLSDSKLTPEINRASYASYIPGSIFKPVIALAALENGLNPKEIYQVQPNPEDPQHGCIYVGSRKIKDTVHPGSYDLRRAIQQSSNAYFIYNGLRTGIDKIIVLGEKFHFGERENLPTLQDAHGIFPTFERVKKSDWHDGDSANIFFGQGEVNVTPMQIATAYSAIANGGTVFWPRLVERIEPQDPTSGEPPTIFQSGLVRDRIDVSQHSLRLLGDAMMSETEDPAGTGYSAFHLHGDPLNWRVCGKTGTAQREDEHRKIIGWNYWFASFAPYENPRYAVIVMVQSEMGGSGGSVCAPIAHDIYEEILKKANSDTPRTAARTN
jgi:penicillin-binding protein 2